MKAIVLNKSLLLNPMHPINDVAQLMAKMVSKMENK